jgi:hypothetical protein
MVAPAVLTDEAVVAAEIIVSRLDCVGPKLVATKIAMQITAIVKAIKGGSKAAFCFMAATT